MLFAIIVFLVFIPICNIIIELSKDSINRNQNKK